MFCAVEIPEPVRQTVLRHIAVLKDAVPDVKATWSRAANLHLTLKFLGEISQTLVLDVPAAASRAVAGLAQFSIRLEGTGTFPKQDQPRVLWVGIKDSSGRLNELHARLDEELACAGFAKDDRAFHPHLTVARLRQPRHARTLAAAHRQLEFKPADIPILELLVIRSELSSEGSQYTVVSRHALEQPDKL